MLVRLKAGKQCRLCAAKARQFGLAPGHHYQAEAGRWTVTVFAPIGRQLVLTMARFDCMFEVINDPVAV